MKKYISILALGAMALFGLGSCTQVNVDEAAPLNQKHSVSFASEIETVDTKGLDLVASPDWKGYIDENVHLYENDYEAESHTAIISDDWKTAYFTAVFGEEVIIDAPITKASKGYTYNGIMASGQDGVFTVPSVQAPTTDARIDPAADVLIGCALTFADPFTSSDQIYLGFVRPVAASRLSIVNIDKTDEDGAANALQSVTIYADSPLTGSFTYEDVDFADGSVAFDSTEGSKTITLNYSNEAVKSIQYAYFVCLPGKVHIEKVVVKTSKYIYTKTVDANTTFDAKKFKDIALDLKENTKREANAAEPEKIDRSVEFAQSAVTLTLGETFNAPELIGDVEGAVITWSSSDEEVATVDAEGKVEILAAGETTITASIAEDDTYNAAEASYTITVNEPAPVVNKKFYKVSAIEDGIEYVIVSNGQAIKNVAAENVDAMAVEVIDNTFEISEEDADSIAWKAIAVTDTDLLQYGKYQFTNASEYLSRISGNSSTSVLKALPSTDSQISTKMKNTMWDYDGAHFVNISIYNTSATNYYATYNDGWKIASSTGTADIYESRVPQTVSFSSTEAQYDLNPDAEAFVAPTLSGAQGAVTYSSSDETVATVASDGTITALKKGTATITAAVAGTDKYQAAVASYTLTVVDTTPVEGRTYVKVTSAPSNWSGTYLFVKESDNVAFAYNKDEYKVAVSISDNKIVSNECSDYELTVSTSSAGAGKYEIRTTNGKYVYRYGSTVLFDTNISNGNQYYALFSGDGNVTINCQRSGGSNNYFQYSSGAFGFGSSNAAIQLYKLEEGGDTPDQPVEKTERNLAFSATTATAKIGAENTFPTLSGETAGVTYASSNTAAATVDAATGAITLVAAGETTITASAEEDDTYKAGNASYTLTVEAADEPAPSTGKTFKKVSAFTSGKNYVIVSGNNALKNNNGSATAYSVSGKVSGDILTVAESDAAAITWGATSNTSDTQCGEYSLKNGSVYIYRDGNDNKFALHTPSGSNLNARYAWTLNGTSMTQKNSKHSYTYYVTYSSGWNLTETQSTVTVYEEYDGGSQPVEKAERNLAFSETTATAKIGAENTFPTLSGETAGVTYASSNTAAATVDAATGAITLVAAGETTITASAAEDDTFKAGNASYTLTVEAADEPTPGGDVTVSLKKATTLTPGKSYVLVSNGYAALNNGSAKDKVQVNDNTVTLPESQKSAIFFTLNGSETKGYTFTNGDDYFGIYMDKNHNPYTYDVRVSATEAPSTNVSLTYLNKSAISSMLDGLIFYKGNSSSYYLYYDATNGWSNFKASNGSAVDSKYNTFLYEEVTGEGDTPVVTTAKYTKVSSLTEGKKYILVDLGENKAFKPILNSGKTGYLNNDKQNAIDVTVNDNTIVADEAVNACQISLKYQDASDKNKFGMVVTIDGTEYALHLNTTGSSVLVADDDTDGYRSTFTPSNGSFKITRKNSNTTYSFRYSASHDYFQVTSSTSATEVALFEYSE